MQKTFDIQIPLLEEALLPDTKQLAARELRIPVSEITACYLKKRSLDARKKNIKVNLRYAAFIQEEPPKFQPAFKLPSAVNADPIHIIGTGPAGLFAALQAIELGFKPILLERGKTVKARRRDLAKLNKEHVVHPESNYCFGEGGAGTYSDGKLYTRSKKRGDVAKILDALIQFGAPANIAIEAHPHIGTNKLPKIIEAIREALIQAGAEFHFESKLTDLKLNKNRITEIEINSTNWIPVQQVVLATGHSARDIFELLHAKKIRLEAKPFALGVRVEHAQDLIDKIQYHGQIRGELLPPASYKLVQQINDKGVYSFCMCPGGIIAPCATKPGELVTNGWSPSKRNNPFANSGMVVHLEADDWSHYEQHGPLAGLRFQEDIERKAFLSVNENEASQYAPAQGLLDFVQGKDSKTLAKCSYFPGVRPARLDQILPHFIAKRLQKAFLKFGKTMPGYLSNDAVVLGVESRTSSPVSIPRDRKKLNHLEIENLFPCGEGAGYAGGIVSAAIDGMKVASAIAETFEQSQPAE